MAHWLLKMLVAAAKSAPLVLLGLYTHELLFKDADTLLPLVGHGCPDAATYPWRTGIQDVDFLLCALVLFFKAAVSTTHGLLVTGYLLTTANAVFAFMAVEGSRAGAGAGWLLALLPAHALLFQLKGISVAVPALWLPLYLLLQGLGGAPDERRRLRRAVSLGRAACIALGLLGMQFAAVGTLLPLPDPVKERFVLGFQVAPVLVPLVWMPWFRSTVGTKTGGGAGGHRAVAAVHLVQAGGGLVWQLVAAAYAVADPRVPAQVWRAAVALVGGHEYGPANWPVVFLALDALVLLVALVYLAALQDGVLVAAVTALASPILGPAASLSCYFAYSELRHHDRLLDLEESKKSF